MVKHLTILVLVFITVACKSNSPKENRDILTYKNYLYPFPFLLDSNTINKSTISNVDTLSIAYVYQKINNYFELCGNDKKYILQEYKRTTNEFDYNNLGEDFVGKMTDTLSTTNNRIWLCGVKKNHSVNIYVFLKEAINTIDKKPHFSIALFSTKKNLLCSVSIVSSGIINDSLNLNTYKDGICFKVINKRFNQSCIFNIDQVGFIRFGPHTTEYEN
jgi:hypothetical protein